MAGNNCAPFQAMAQTSACLVRSAMNSAKLFHGLGYSIIKKSYLPSIRIIFCRKPLG